MKPRRVSAANQFSRFLKRTLDNLHFRSIKDWRINWRLPGTRETVDIAGLGSKGKPRILVEVERLRDNLASNVTKVWHCAAIGRGLPRRAVLVQALSGAFKGPKAVMKSRAIFIGMRMHRELPGINYQPKDFSLKPKSRVKVLGGASKRHAERLARWVHRNWSHF